MWWVRLGKGSETTLRIRYHHWNAHGAFDALADEAIDGYDRMVGLDLSEVSVDGSMHKAPWGIEGTGKSPVDRGKSGWKWSRLCDRGGIPVGWAADGANRHEQVLLEPTLADASRRGLRNRRQQSPCVRMARALIQLISVTDLTRLPQIHDHDPT